ncbi:MAG: hypothetical protein RMK65_10060 [Anaerolineae bacterium]|nr:hypothetical protein [Anaerolineae bacterium]MCX8068736.1 hypothetical protein [Anaerolineae bacterium]MDW7992450.1 hypothetical protein [Anaerolineae bacterium]
MQEDRLTRREWLPDFEELSEKPGGQETFPKRQVLSSGLAGLIGALAPWQRFVLALLLFLDVALLGCMCLVMTGRVVPFFP